MDKLLSTTKRRQRDLRHRDIFEKAMPEVKKNREDREMGNTEYTKPGVEDGMSIFVKLVCACFMSYHTKSYDRVSYYRLGLIYF